MTGPAAIAYQALLAELLDRRDLQGDLPPEVEDRYTDDLDRLWGAMSAEERDEVELPGRRMAR